MAVQRFNADLTAESFKLTNSYRQGVAISKIIYIVIA